MNTNAVRRQTAAALGVTIPPSVPPLHLVLGGASSTSRTRPFEIDNDGL